ncbi:MAG: glycosyltransferase [Sphingobacteriales bacterium]|nr:MAG: glycosyltransferase [Sphingobacteriales bacterium]
MRVSLFELAVKIKKYINSIDYFISDQDLGMYDALNKGIGVATGDLVGVLNADDCLASFDVISSVVDCFSKMGCDAVYGNLKFIKRSTEYSITRNWKSRPYNLNDLLYGWMPPHPTLYIKRNILHTAGRYSLKFGACADYDMILRLLYRNRVNAVFLDKQMVIMRKGGMSNGSVKKVASAIINDYRILVHNGIPNPLVALMLKKVRKLNQFFS